MKHVLALTLAIALHGCIVGEPEKSDFAPAVEALAGTLPDRWDPVVGLQSPAGDGLAPVHATVLPDGRVLLAGVYRPGPRLGFDAVLDPPDPALPSPASVVLNVEPTPYRVPDTWAWPWHAQDSLFCSGHTLLSDGSVLYVGGTRLSNYYESLTHRYDLLFGLDYALRFDPVGDVWSDAGSLVGQAADDSTYRWYPTTTRLHDGRVLVTSGWVYNYVREYSRASTLDPWTEVQSWYGPPNLSIEVYDDAGTFSELVAEGDAPPQIFNKDYTHAFQMPVPEPTGQDVLMFGEFGYPVLMSSTSGAFEQRVLPRPGTAIGQESMNGASTVMLPIRVDDGQWGYANGSVLVAGGGMGTFLQSADIYDVGADAWTRVDLETPRHHPSTVLLPDGTIAVLAGHDPTGGLLDLGVVSYVDPRNEFAVYAGETSMPFARGYHTVSVLLADGRVLVGGGRSSGSSGPEDESPSFQFLRPWYMSYESLRPVISDAPTSIEHATDFDVAWTGFDVGEVTLMALGSMTHSFDQNQRAVQLEVVTSGPGTATVRGPRDAFEAPPGHYMLFVVDQYRLPSVARIVVVQ